MNERLNKLLDEAKLTAVQEMFEPELEKFAELIVQHCTYQCYLIGESGLAHELSDEFGFEFDFRKMLEDEDE